MTNNDTSAQPVQNAAKADGDNLFDYAWGKLIGGTIAVGLAFWLNSLFTDLETGATESIRIHTIIAFLYNTLGHMPTVLIIGGIGVLLLVLGIRQLITERQ